MAEDSVSQDQHCADIAELRLELANTLASLDKRTELIAQDLIAFRREQYALTRCYEPITTVCLSACHRELRSLPHRH